MNWSAKELRRDQFLFRVYCDIIQEHLRSSPEINNYCLFLVMVSDTLYVLKWCGSSPFNLERPRFESPFRWCSFFLMILRLSEEL